MDLHIVGGFLGSGKTTAIIGATRQLMTAGKRVGVITNDQGRYLVDTAFFRLGDVPTVEVTGGCFCCNYDDLNARLDHLRSVVNPDVIFAESVGSCADIVATVIKPLKELRAAAAPTSFTVFVDIRLLRRRLLEQAMPFSDDVVYIFDKQIEEAGLLVINKRDLLPSEAAEAVLALARERFGDKAMRLQNSVDAESVREWLEWMGDGRTLSTAVSLDIDYARYGQGESRLAWLDEQVVLTVARGSARELVVGVLSSILARLENESIPIGHVKFLVEWDGGNVKLSFPALPAVNWSGAVPEIPGATVSVLVNARVEAHADTLQRAVQRAVAEATAGKAGYREAEIAAFHPGLPKPTHRL